MHTSPEVKAAFLSQQQLLFVEVFKGLSQDAYPIVQYVLDVCWNHIWSDRKLSRSVKISVFSESTLQQARSFINEQSKRMLIKLYNSQLLRLYEQSANHGTDGFSTADIVHHFLLSICTHRGVGICFADLGWYDSLETKNSARENAAEASEPRYRIRNKILLNLLRFLKIEDDARQYELACRILSCCPELVSPFLPTIRLSVETSLSSKWLSNLSFLIHGVSLPVPADSFVASSGNDQSCYRPSPPALHTVLDNILPTRNAKSYFVKALQSTKPLVQFFSSIYLCCCLVKFKRVVSIFHQIAAALEEDTMRGEWSSLCRNVAREFQARIPDFQVTLSIYQTQQPDTTQRTRNSALSVVSKRLVWLYHLCVPSLMTGINYDFLKHLQADEEKEELFQITREGFYPLARLYILRAVKETIPAVLTVKAGKLLILLCDVSC